MIKHLPKVIASLAFLPFVAPTQPLLAADDSPAAAASAATSSGQVESKRILWIIPNYRTVPSTNDFTPLTASDKFGIATQDAFDRGTFVLGAMFAGIGQLTDSNKSFGQGAKGYGRYFGTSYGDLGIGNYMTEAIFPSLLHQDPRFFRRGTGTGRSRLRYAVSQTFLTHGDSGKTQVNFSELIGNSAAVAISTAYYPDNRTASNAVSRLGMQLGVDMAGNILKEFWPELKRKFSRRRHYAE